LAVGKENYLCDASCSNKIAGEYFNQIKKILSFEISAKK